MNKLYAVSEEVLRSFLADKSFTTRMGMTVHSTEYLDDAGNVIADMMTSSWSNGVWCRIADESYANLETLNLVGNIIQEKSK